MKAHRTDGSGSAHAVGAALLAGLLALPVLLLPPATNPLAAGSRVYNLDPAFTDANNDLVWDPNFIPGFNGTPGVQINWSAPTGGPGSISYYVGPWTSPTTAAYPHFVVGPQAFNFVEVPRTQVYRSPAWGDYASVRQGFLPCAVNLGNYTVDPTQALHPVYIGMNESKGAWYVRLNLQWSAPLVDTRYGADGKFELVTTTTLPPAAPGGYPRLVYTELVLWNWGPPGAASLLTTSLPKSASSDVAGDVAFNVTQLQPTTFRQSLWVPLSPYLTETLGRLGLSASGALLSYVYVSTAGFNIAMHVALGGLWLMGPSGACP